MVDDKGREKERYQVVYGAKILFDDGAPVRENEILLEWAPYTFSILPEATGTIHFKDLTDGVTMQERVSDESKRTASNLAKHGVSFEDGSTVSAIRLAGSRTTRGIQWNEARCAPLGMARSGRLLAVVVTERAARFGSSARGERRGGERNE